MLNVQKVLILLGSSYEDFKLSDSAIKTPQNMNNEINLSHEADMAVQLISTLNELQRAVFEKIMDAVMVKDYQPKCFFF